MVSSRRQARERALSLLYEAEARSTTIGAVMAELPLPVEEFARELAEGVERERDDIDARIAAKSRGWDLDRMANIDRIVLEMACFELLHRPEIPTGAVLNEAVELAKQYSTDQSGGFVNGVLAAIAAEAR